MTPKRKPHAETWTPMTPEQSARFRKRLALLSRVDRLRRDMFSAEGFALEALALEAVRISKESGDLDSQSKLVTTFLAILDANHKPPPWGSVDRRNGDFHVPLVLRPPEAAMTLAEFVAPCLILAADRNKALPRELRKRIADAEIDRDAIGVLQSFPEHFPANASERSDLLDALCSEAVTPRATPGTLAAAAARAWGCDKKTCARIARTYRERKASK